MQSQKRSFIHWDYNDLIHWDYILPNVILSSHNWDYNDYHIGGKSPILFGSAVDVFAIHSIKTQTLRKGPPCDFFVSGREKRSRKAV